jgi:hypothetical protein
MQIYILALIPIVLPPLIVACIHWYNLLVAHLPKQVQSTLHSVTQTVVAAAEQSSTSSANKKLMAQEDIDGVLKSLGYTVDPAYINAAIEAAVLALHTATMVIPPIVVAPVVVPPVGVPVEIVAPLPPVSPVIVPIVPTN